MQLKKHSLTKQVGNCHSICRTVVFGRYCVIYNHYIIIIIILSFHETKYYVTS